MSVHKNLDFKFATSSGVTATLPMLFRRFIPCAVFCFVLGAMRLTVILSLGAILVVFGRPEIVPIPIKPISAPVDFDKPALQS